MSTTTDPTTTEPPRSTRPRRPRRSTVPETDLPNPPAAKPRRRRLVALALATVAAAGGTAWMIAAGGGDAGPAPVEIVEDGRYGGPDIYEHSIPAPGGQTYGSADAAERQTAPETAADDVRQCGRRRVPDDAEARSGRQRTAAPTPPSTRTSLLSAATVSKPGPRRRARSPARMARSGAWSSRRSPTSCTRSRPRTSSRSAPPAGRGQGRRRQGPGQGDRLTAQAVAGRLGLQPPRPRAPRRDRGAGRTG